MIKIIRYRLWAFIRLGPPGFEGSAKRLRATRRRVAKVERGAFAGR